MSRLQMNMFSWVLVLIVQSGKKVKFTRTIHVLLLLQYCQALLECCTACHSIASSSLLLMLTWLMQIVVLSKKKMDLLKIVPFSPTARSSIFGPQYCQALLECCTACHSIAIKFKFQEFASLIPPGLSTIQFLITTGRPGDEALSSTLLGLGQLQNAFAEALKSSYYMYWVYTAAV